MLLFVRNIWLEYETNYSMCSINLFNFMIKADKSFLHIYALNQCLLAITEKNQGNLVLAIKESDIVFPSYFDKYLVEIILINCCRISVRVCGETRTKRRQALNSWTDLIGMTHVENVNFNNFGFIKYLLNVQSS